jgi:SAM-dependent methyltransferase
VKREEWNRKYASPEFLWSTDPNRFLVAEVEGLQPGRALDLACGEGRNAVWLAEQGWRVTAVDFSEIALAKAERLAESRGVAVEWIAADLLDYRPPGTFDLVAVLYLQLPRDDRRLVLGRAREALAPGGTLLVVGHDLSNLAEGYGGPTQPAVLLTPDGIVRDLPGLVIERAERVRRRIATDDGEQEAIDALVRATKPRS